MQKRLWLAAAVAAVGVLTVPAAASAAPGPSASVTSVPGVSSLNGVTCPTAKACVSVGLDNNFTGGKSAVITVATGAVKAWSGDLANDPMNAVACPSTTSCLAAADGAVASVAVSNGAMKVTAKPKKPVVGIVALGTIACAGTTACYAAGFEGNESASKAVVIRLSPAGKLLATEKSKGTSIAAIACPSASLCLLGEHFTSGESIVLLNNGAFGASHALPAGSYIEAMSCYKASLCYALGGNGSSTPDEVFPLNPKTGAIGSSATISGFNGAAVSCLSASTCVVVGLTGTGSTAKAATVTVVNGKPGKPTIYPGSSLSFHGVACPSSSVCYAAGSSSSGAIVDKVKP
jgi:hypothetical protein